jgi:hypothetical protein
MVGQQTPMRLSSLKYMNQKDRFKYLKPLNVTNYFTKVR